MEKEIIEKYKKRAISPAKGERFNTIENTKYKILKLDSTDSYKDNGQFISEIWIEL